MYVDALYIPHEPIFHNTINYVDFCHYFTCLWWLALNGISHQGV